MKKSATTSKNIKPPTVDMATTKRQVGQMVKCAMKQGES